MFGLHRQAAFKISELIVKTCIILIVNISFTVSRRALGDLKLKLSVRKKYIKVLAKIESRWAS